MKKAALIFSLAITQVFHSQESTNALSLQSNMGMREMILSKIYQRQMEHLHHKKSRKKETNKHKKSQEKKTNQETIKKKELSEQEKGRLVLSEIEKENELSQQLKIGQSELQDAAKQIQESETEDLEEIFTHKQQQLGQKDPKSNFQKDSINPSKHEKKKSKTSHTNDKNENQQSVMQSSDPAPTPAAPAKAAEPVNEFWNLFGPDPVAKNAATKKKKLNPNDVGFGNESNDIKFNPEYRKLMDQILGKNPNSEYYKKIRPQDKEGYKGRTNSTPIQKINARYNPHDQNYGYDSYINEKHLSFEDYYAQKKEDNSTYDYYNDYPQGWYDEPEEKELKGFFQGAYDPYSQDEYDEYGAGEGKYPLDHVVEEKEYINDLLNRGYQPTWDEKSGRRIYVPDPSVYNYRKVVFDEEQAPTKALTEGAPAEGGEKPAEGGEKPAEGGEKPAAEGASSAAQKQSLSQEDTEENNQDKSNAEQKIQDSMKTIDEAEENIENTDNEQLAQTEKQQDKSEWEDIVETLSADQEFISSENKESQKIDDLYKDNNQNQTILSEQGNNQQEENKQMQQKDYQQAIKKAADAQNEVQNLKEKLQKAEDEAKKLKEEAQKIEKKTTIE